METSSDNLPTTDDATQATGMVPEAPDNAREDATPEGAPAAAAAMAARGAGAVAAGFSAMRDVRRAAKQSASARARLQAIRKQIDADQKVLDRRVDVESRYDQIVAEQTAELARANRESDQADAEATRLGREHDELKARLEALKKDNAQRLAPYKDLADAARGRTDDAAKALSEARRAVKTAEGQVADATSKRDERTASAEQALANARDRLSKLKTQLAAIETDPDQARVAAELRESIATETARVAAAESDVTTVAAQAQQTLENAQTHLYTQRKSLEDAEQQHEAAKADSAKRKEEFEGLSKQARAAEKELDDQVVDLSNDERAASKRRDAAQRDAQKAQELLNEANDVHATPEKTVELRDSISDQQAAFVVQQRQVEALEGAEKSLRERTKRSRALFVAVAVLAVVLLVLVVLLATGVIGR